MIELGLSRIVRLLQQTPLTWKAIHIAGTNGKGSICALASRFLLKKKVQVGRFTSPHLVHRFVLGHVRSQVSVSLTIRKMGLHPY